MTSPNSNIDLEMDAGAPEGIAIIGMAGRFPGAADLAAFWDNLIAGRDTITRFGAEEVTARNAGAKDNSDFVAARGVLEDAAMFDAEYFGISPREADSMDPQHRVFLEACSNALEDAGYVSSDYAGEIGLFAGCSLNTYLLANLARDRNFLDELTGNYQVGEFQVALGNDKDFLTTRAAYKLNLRGPCVTVQSACATSLVAICQASQALLNYQCDMALAGGVSVTFPQERGHVYQEGGIVSNDGHCRPFDANATGTVFGHGVGVVVLKRLDDALRDGDHIAAVIRGFAVNNDGSAKAGYMAPGVDGQARVIAAAQAMAGFDPASITYVEAHGTGTPLGDPIEVAALTKVFRASTNDRGFCTIGTAKGNVGHLDSAAGVTGVIKTALSMQHKTIPGLAHFVSANKNIELSDSPFVFRSETTPWSSEEPLRAGVSAFGVGGVNAHVVLEEAPEQTSDESLRGHQVLCISGRTEAATLRAAQNLSAYIAANPKISIADTAFTLACGRRAHEFRSAIAVSDAADAQRQLAAITKANKSRAHKVAFQFSGQGTQYVGMGRALYEAEPAYHDVVDDACSLLEPILGLDLRSLMFADTNDVAAAAQLERTEFAQPAIFITELALAELWRAWGITPQAMVGHSLGEYVAATIAGVFSREDALRLVALRGSLMQSLTPGAMISVPLGETALRPYITADVCVAGLNSPRASVLSGPIAAIEALEAKLESDGVASRRLRTSHAFHSAMMEPMLAKFEAAVGKLQLNEPKLPFVSSVTGTWITAEGATSPQYWAMQCRQPVRYSDAVGCLISDGYDLLLEVGAGKTLTTLAQQHATKDQSVVSVASFTHSDSIELAVTALWTAGVLPDWEAYFAQERRLRISLPTYPFERKLHWIAPPAKESPLNATHNQPTVSLSPLQALGSTSIEAEVPQVSVPRSTRLRTEIARVFTELSGIETTPDEAEYQFLELGFDSLFLTQATQSLQKAFGVKLTFRQLMEQFSTIASLAHYLDSVLPTEAFAETPAPTQSLAPSSVDTASMQPIERLLSSQIATLTQLFTDQVAALQAIAGQAPLQTAKPIAARPVPTGNEQVEVRFRQIQPKAQQELTAEQQKYIADLIARYEAKTPGSKRLTQAGRGQLADPRAVAGFRPQWKEMVYPLITDRALGSRLWDVDGNEYIDIVNGYGCIMFGHSPDFVVAAAREQLERGVAIGPQTPLAAEVAALICELTGNERVTFCNTGSEAVMAAIRVARTVTGRDKIVYFTGDYHGTFDEVLIRNTPRGSAPVAPGIPLANVTNVVVLDYGADQSLEYLRTHGDEIAAVIIEPVQTRHPEVKPFEFIRSVRSITNDTGSAMVLDEVVTGFRLAPGGVQEYLGVRADMCTYGKVIGGGHPIGVLSGKAMYLDALDGGTWQYGDDSGPEVGVTFFAGTFVRHPLALAAARSVLLHLKQAGPALQQDLNAKTAKLAESLDRFFVERGVPTRIHHFASWFYFTFPSDARLGTLLYYAMRAKGIHIQEGYPCFLTTAHTQSDFDEIERVFHEVVIEMQEANALPTGAANESKCSCLHAAALATTPAQVPLTEPQREVFLAAALNPEANCAFNESLTLHLRGAVRKDNLIKALAQVFNRHDALRSTVSEDGEMLHIADTCAVRPAFVDLREVAGSEQDAALESAAELEGKTPFDLTQGPLVRAICYELAGDHLALMITAHHIVLDGWSANQLLEEVGRVYSKGVAAELAPLLPFSSYAMRERERDQNGEYVANEVYWVDKFQGRSPRLELPTDRPRPLMKSYHGHTLEGRLGSDVYAELKKASARAVCTLYVTLLSGFQILLHRLTGQDEVVVGISTAGQSLIEDASLVGHCVHFLPMLSELTEDITVPEHLRATKTALLDAYDHQEFTYGSLLRKLRLDREPGRLPLIEVQFNLERVGANVVFDGLQTTMRANPKQFVNTDLFLNVIETADDLEFMCDFNTDLFNEETVARWLQSWAELLKSEATSADQRVDELNLLSDSERAKVVFDWNQTSIPFAAFEPAYAALLARAASSPTAVALECNGVTWSSGRLVEYARSLASELINTGLRPGDLVGICVERSAEMVGAVLAVMLAGGAYVPLDPRHPQERLQMVLDDSGAAILLVTHDLGFKTSAKVLNIAKPLAAAPKDFKSVAITADSLAYVIYTSGSTGKPKGVAIEHGALLNLLRSMQRKPGLDASDVLVAITTLAFDIAGLELLLPLLTGAKLVVATDAEVLDGRLLLGLLERTKATTLQATPGAWRILIDAGWTNALPLKALCGGEALPRELAEKLLDRASEVWNVYGPTETTIWSSATRVEHGIGALRIGPPIANTQFYVLDQRRQPVPIGVAGELFIGGAGLARGYWNRPELTAEKFIQNPFGEGRIYATGDLARWHDDGSIELLGRADFQVKIRGYRIELQEIEAAILQHPQAKETVVVQNIAENGVSRLVAYVAVGELSDNICEAIVSDLKAALGRTLPDYVIPNIFVTLAALPRNSNGKIDRKALPAPDGEASDWIHSTVAREDYVAPSDVIERQLADIWQTTLGIPLISVRTSFFSLGAGSLAALRLITKMNRVYAMELGLASLVSASTIESIAELIRTRFAPNTDSSVVPLQPKGTRPPLFIVHGVGGNVVNFYGLSMRVGSDQPVYGIQSQALVANQPALLHLQDMATHYIGDIRKVQPKGPYHLLGYSFGGTVVLEMAHQLRAAGEEVALVGMIDSKSKDYELQLARLTTVHTKINRRMNRFVGNTDRLPWKARFKYIQEKVTTRAIRFACMAAAALKIKQVPAFMRSAYDINYVAVQNYTVRPYDGKLVLFRASYQGQEEGEYDLGWSSIFKQGAEIHDLPGDHERIFLEPNIEQLATSLREALARA